MRQLYVRRAVSWLTEHQTPTAALGECCVCYRDREMEDCGPGPRVPRSAVGGSWGSSAAGEAHSPEVKAGVDYLLKTQFLQGRWEEPHFTGTGFPGHFMIRYHPSRDCFPLMALGQYQQAVNAETER